MKIDKELNYDGGSLAVRIPKLMIDWLNVNEHSTVCLEDKELNGEKQIIITKKTKG